jgi:dTDP-4-dehydrorhamnose 3,5-epimerase
MVDLRADSPSTGDQLGVELTGGNGPLAYVPQSFAQGYQTLEDDTEILNQMSHHYVPEAARGVRWDDPAFSIDWPPAEERIISSRGCSWQRPRPLSSPLENGASCSVRKWTRLGVRAGERSP